MKTLATLLLFSVTQMGFASTHSKVELTGFGKATGPRGGLACQNAERKATADLRSRCSVLGPGASLIKESSPKCSCFSRQNMFEDCSATAWGVCEL